MSVSWGLPVFWRSQIKMLALRLTNLLQILWFFSVPPGKCQDSISNWAMTASSPSSLIPGSHNLN